MNTRIIYNGGITVFDEQGKPKPIEYTDNLEKILNQENLVEAIQKQITELKEDIEKNKYYEKRYIPTVIPGTIIALILTRFLFPPLLGVDTTVLTESIFGPINEFILMYRVFAILITSFATIMETILYSEYKTKRKIRRANIEEHKALQKELAIQKQKLETLHQEKTITNKPTNSFVDKRLDTKGIPKEIQQRMNFYWNLGYDLDKYSKYYIKGKLDNMLIKKKYSKQAIEIIKERVKKYLKEAKKGKRKIRKK